MAMRRIAHSGLKSLPVVSRSNVRELKGTIAVSDILAAYGVGKVKEEAAAEAPLVAKAPGRMLAGVVAALVLLAIGAGLLNYFSRAQRASRAQRYFQEANELFAKERYDEAVTQYRNALSITHSVDTRLALGVALVKAERPNEASIYLSEVLRERPADADANLATARADTQEERINDAVLAYHRAIYGHWPDRGQENRFRTRIELVEMLDRAHRRSQAQAELLEAVTEAPADPASQKQLGRMLIDYGMSRQAADVFRKLSQSSHDAEGYQGLGDAQLALGDAAAARDAYREAVKVDPSDAAAAKKLDLCERILALDPSAPRLNAAERYRRSRELLANVAECAGAEVPPEPKKRPKSLSDAADANVAEALKLWEQGTAACTSDEALARVMAKLRRA
jgi:tetratricopeptide (TPR) repeat protein